MQIQSIVLDASTEVYPIRHVWINTLTHDHLYEVILNGKMLHYVVPSKDARALAIPIHEQLLAHPEWLTHESEIDFCDYEQLDIEPVVVTQPENMSSTSCPQCGSPLHSMYCGECDSLELGY